MYTALYCCVFSCLICRSQQQQLLEARAPSPDPCGHQQRDDAEAVSALLEAVGFSRMLPDAAAVEDQHLPGGQQAAGSRGSSPTGTVLHRGAESGQRRLQQVKDLLLEQQQHAAAAEEQAKAEAASRAAAEAAAKQKPYRCGGPCWLILAKTAPLAEGSMAVLPLH